MIIIITLLCQIYCCTGFLSLTGQLHQVNADLLGWWLCERQLSSGGLNGRPEKVGNPFVLQGRGAASTKFTPKHCSCLCVLCPSQLPDVCYSWWVLASLKIIGRIDWIDKAKLRRFILACQDDEMGGFADRPGDVVSCRDCIVDNIFLLCVITVCLPLLLLPLRWIRSTHCSESQVSPSWGTTRSSRSTRCCVCLRTSCRGTGCNPTSSAN